MQPVPVAAPESRTATPASAPPPPGPACPADTLGVAHGGTAHRAFANGSCELSLEQPTDGGASSASPPTATTRRKCMRETYRSVIKWAISRPVSLAIGANTPRLLIISRVRQL